MLRLTQALHRHRVPHLLRDYYDRVRVRERTDPAALVVGPTGVGLGPHGTLYVADTLGNRITAVPGALFRRPSAGTGHPCTSRRPEYPARLGRPQRQHLTVNSGDGSLVETTPAACRSPAATR